MGRYDDMPTSENIEDRREGGGGDEGASSDPTKPFGEQPEGYAGHGLSAEAGYYDVGGRRGSPQKGASGSGQGDDRPIKGGVLSEAYKQGGPVVDPRAKARNYPKKSPFKL